MVVDDIDDDRDPAGMGVADERLERVRPAIGRLDGEQVGRVVAPRDVPGELERRHHLDRRHAEVVEVAEPPSGLVERPGPLARWRERPDVHLVDDEVIPGGHGHGIVAPLEGVPVVDDAVADRVRHQPGVRIDPRQVAAGGPDRESVLVAGDDAVDVGRPCLGRAVIVARQRDIVTGPVVERAGHEDGRRVGRPDAERRAARVGDCSHAGAR